MARGCEALSQNMSLLLLLLASTSVCAVAGPTVDEVSAEQLEAETSKHEVCSCLPFSAGASRLL